jgi:hypothetical protein
VPASAPRASDPLIVHLGADDDPVGDEMGRFVLNTFQTKSMVKYRCGHGLGLLRIVRLPSNNTDPAMSIFNFQLSGYAFAGRPTNNPKERRLQRLASPTPLDHRISYGCINVPAKFYNNVVSPAFTSTYGIVYVLPETRSISEIFALYYDVE